MNSQPDLAEITERIRQAAHRQNHPASPLPVAGTMGVPTSAIPEPLPPPPSLNIGRAGESSSGVILEEAANMVPRAHEKNTVSSGVPGFLRPLFRNQGGVNGILLEAVGHLVEINRQLRNQNVEMQERLMTYHGWMNAVTQHAARTREWMVQTEAKVTAINEQQAKTNAIEAHGTRLGEHLANLQRQADALEAHGSRLGDHLNNLQSHSDKQSAFVDGKLDEALAATGKAQARQSLLEENARRLEERHMTDAAYLKSQLLFQQRVLQQMLPAGGANGNGSEHTPPTQQAAATLAEHDLDSLYLAFEDVFRGNRADIKANLHEYLPYLEKAHAGTPDKPILDLGCGRGEWLELLRESGLTASGIDLNEAMIAQCRDRGLDAKLADAVSHLKSLSEASCGAVTAFHLIEHLPFRVLVKFLRECRRVLQPGGIAIFETPNPYNVAVGSGRFYHDFTHERPLPPKSTQFIVEQMGFARVDILPLHPCDDVNKVPTEGSPALAERFNELFYGPQDYAILAVA